MVEEEIKIFDQVVEEAIEELFSKKDPEILKNIKSAIKDNPQLKSFLDNSYTNSRLLDTVIALYNDNQYEDNKIALQIIVIYKLLKQENPNSKTINEIIKISEGLFNQINKFGFSEEPENYDDKRTKIITLMGNEIRKSGLLNKI